MSAIRDRLKRVPGALTTMRSIRRLFAALNPLNWDATERLLLALLRVSVHGRLFRDWTLSSRPPHFGYHNYDALKLAFFDRVAGPYSFSRAFFASLLVREGAQVLDIGCGDGFFAKRFLAIKAAHVDAIDIDGDALRFARRYNTDSKVTFHHSDAAAQPFPKPAYDLIVWDGAIGHFSQRDSDVILRKIKSSLTHGGVFCGSEQLGRVPEEDHLQHFENLDQVHALLAPHFRHIELFTLEYFCEPDRIGARVEFFWRASDVPERIAAAGFLRWG